MSNPAVSTRELELEGAELLPSRETLCCPSNSHSSGGGVTSIFAQTGYGNTAQSGLLNVSALNGSFDNILSLGSGTVL
jgi:hypothetical protein